MIKQNVVISLDRERPLLYNSWSLTWFPVAGTADSEEEKQSASFQNLDGGAKVTFTFSGRSSHEKDLALHIDLSFPSPSIIFPLRGSHHSFKIPVIHAS